MSEPNSSAWVAFTGAALAPMAGDYSVIIFSSLVGAMWALAAQQTQTRKEGALLVLRLALTAAVLTSFIAYLVETTFQVPAAKVLGPVALAIGGMGNRWQAVFEGVGRVVSVVLGSVGGGKQ